MSRTIPTLLRSWMMSSPLGGMDGLEDRIAQMPDVHRWTEDSPVRFEIMKAGMMRGRGGPDLDMVAIMLPTLLGVQRSLRSLDTNPARPKSVAPPEFIAGLEATLLDLGASSVGYTRVPLHWIFQEKAILQNNAIVITGIGIGVYNHPQFGKVIRLPGDILTRQITVQKIIEKKFKQSWP